MFLHTLPAAGTFHLFATVGLEYIQIAHSAAASTFGGVVANWLGTRECTCNCRLGGSQDNGALNLVQKQLARCGPENLTRSLAPYQPVL